MPAERRPEVTIVSRGICDDVITPIVKRATMRVCEIECGDGEGTLALHDDGLIREFFAGGNIDGGDVITNE